MRILIFGCGYLGLPLSRTWLAEGQVVFATTRSPRRAGELREAGILPVIGDVTDGASLAGLPEVDVAVWAVGLDRSAGMPMERVYVEGLDVALGALPGSPRLVYVSSTSVYGQADGSAVDETAETNPVEASGQVVLRAEGVLRSRRPAAVVLRFAGIYGPGRLLREKDLRAGRPLAIDPEKWLNLIHVEDGVRAIRAACSVGRPGETYNVCDDRPTRRRAYYTRLAERLGAPAPRFVAPAEKEMVDRRVVNRRMRVELGVSLAFPSFEEGLAVSCGGAAAP